MHGRVNKRQRNDIKEETENTAKACRKVTKSGQGEQLVMKCRARATAHLPVKRNTSPQSKRRAKSPHCMHDRAHGIPKKTQLTGSLVFDEEQFEALLESVLIHIELHLHPKRRMWRRTETKKINYHFHAV